MTENKGEQPERCKGRTHDKRYPYSIHNCTRKAWKDGYCKTHHPEEKANKNKERMRIKDELYAAAQPSKVQEDLKKENELLEARDVAWQNKHSFLMEEIRELKAWKESAISVMPDMQAIGKALNVPLGQSVHDKILPGIERLKGLIDIAYSTGKYAGHHLSGSEEERYHEQFKTKNRL